MSCACCFAVRVQEGKGACDGARGHSAYAIFGL